LVDGSWKARVEFLLIVIGFLFISLTVEALQGKMCQNSLSSGVGRSLGAKILGGKGRPWGKFLIYLTIGRLFFLFQSLPLGKNCMIRRQNGMQCFSLYFARGSSGKL